MFTTLQNNLLSALGKQGNQTVYQPRNGFYLVQTELNVAQFKVKKKSKCAKILYIFSSCHSTAIFCKQIFFPSLHHVINMLTLTQRAHRWPLIYYWFMFVLHKLQSLLSSSHGYPSHTELLWPWTSLLTPVLFFFPLIGNLLPVTPMSQWGSAVVEHLFVEGRWRWRGGQCKYSYTFWCWTSQGVVITEMFSVPQAVGSLIYKWPSPLKTGNPVKTLHAAAD